MRHGWDGTRWLSVLHDRIVGTVLELEQFLHFWHTKFLEFSWPVFFSRAFSRFFGAVIPRNLWTSAPKFLFCFGFLLCKWVDHFSTNFGRFERFFFWRLQKTIVPFRFANSGAYVEWNCFFVSLRAILFIKQSKIMPIWTMTINVYTYVLYVLKTIAQICSLLQMNVQKRKILIVYCNLLSHDFKKMHLPRMLVLPIR